MPPLPEPTIASTVGAIFADTCARILPPFFTRFSIIMDISEMNGSFFDESILLPSSLSSIGSLLAFTESEPISSSSSNILPSTPGTSTNELNRSQSLSCAALTISRIAYCGVPS